ncbi:MAG: Ig-like domain-containing protein [Ectothiorhodospiraceae bacterium]|nr:Ig-like domain-containing protein [Ectothiorhodospiraceae bacterium]
MEPCRLLPGLVLLVASTAALAVGVPNVARTPGELLSGPNAPEAGRTPVIAYHGGMLFTFPEAPGSPPGDYQVRVWDVSDPTDPAVTQVIGPTRHGFMAHGFIKHGDRLNSGYTLTVEPDGTAVEADEVPFRMLGWTHGGMSVPWGVTNFWSYGDTSEPAELYLDRQWGQAPNATFDPVGDTGVIGHPFVLGRYLFYASDQSRTGIASYDVSDPANPVLLDVLTAGSVGGYWPDPFGLNGRLYFFFPHDNPEGGFQVVDATDPTDLRLVADITLEGKLNYAQFQDEFAFSERYKIDMRTFDVVLTLDQDADHRVGERIDTSQFNLPLGNLLVTGGIYTSGTCTVPGFASTHCGTGMSIWAHQAEPDTRGPFVGFHAPADGETGYPVTHPIQVLIHETLRSETINADTVRVRPVVNGVPGAPIATELWFSSNDILSIVPMSPLAADTTYRVELVENGIRDAMGNGMQPYAFEFSTGNTVAGTNARPVIDALDASPRPVAPGQSVAIVVTASDPDDDALEYRFDLGDGSPLTAWGSASSVNHVYAEPGHYTVSAQARDPALALATATTGVTVLVPSADASGPASAQMAHRPAAGGAGEIWVVNPDTSTVSVVDAATREVLAEHRVCADPRAVAIDAGGNAWITCHDADEIAVLAPDGRRLATIGTGYGSAPMDVVVAPGGGRALVTLHGSGELVLIDTGTRAELDRIALGPTPKAIAMTADGARALVTRFVSGPTEGEVWDVAVGASSLALTRTVALPAQWGTDERFDGRGVPNYVADIAIARDGARAWVVAKKDNTTRGLYASGDDLDQDNTVRAMVMQIDLATGVELQALRRDLDNSEQPTAIAFSPLGDYAFVALQGGNAVLVLDALKIEAGFSGASSVVSRVGVGAAPQSLLLLDSDAAPRLWAHDFLGRSATVIDLDPLLATGAPTFPTASIALVGRETLPESVLRGKRIFYHAADPRMSGEGYLGCASCHVDGGHDGRTWDFTGRGEGMRNTTTLRGRAGMGHGLVHWSANFDEIQDFEHDIRGPFGGSGFLTDQQFAAASTPLGPPKAGMSAALDDLAAYVASLDLATIPRSPHRQADGALTAAAARGAAVFAAAGCATCHGGAEGTVSTGLTPDLRDVGSVGTRSGGRLGGALAGIDVPTLHGVWSTAPYLHNGEATTLEAVFAATGAEVAQAEDASLAGSHEVRTSDHWSLTQRAVVREGRFVHLGHGGSATFAHTAPVAGSARLVLRYHANYTGSTITLTVNGVSQSVAVPATLLGDWPYRAWGEHAVDVDLVVGTNTIAVRFDAGVSFALDEIALADTAQKRAAASPHRSVLDLGAGDRADLLAYLRELDARPPGGLAIAIAAPADGADATAPLAVSGTSSGGETDQVLVSIGNRPFVPATGKASWQASLSTAELAPGWHTVSARLVDGATGTWTETQRQVRIAADAGCAGIDTDGDGLPDACDPDDDGDGMPDTFEDIHDLDRLDAADAALDPDGDGRSNLREYRDGTDPRVADEAPVDGQVERLLIIIYDLLLDD